jgi:hypothetical protein
VLLLAPFVVLHPARRAGFMQRLVSVVPNAFLERTIYMFDRVHTTAATISGAAQACRRRHVVSRHRPLADRPVGRADPGVVAALFAWIPVVGSVLHASPSAGRRHRVSQRPWYVYASVAVFLLNRLLDAFVIMPLTVGRSIRMHRCRPY